MTTTKQVNIDGGYYAVINNWPGEGAFTCSIHHAEDSGHRSPHNDRQIEILHGFRNPADAEQWARTFLRDYLDE